MNSEAVAPQLASAEGRVRYPATDGIYIAPDSLFLNSEMAPCTCSARCPNPCTGDCGCSACTLRSTVESHFGSTYPVTNEEIEAEAHGGRGHE